MQIKLNEKTIPVRLGITLSELAESHKPSSDVLILNGFVSCGDMVLRDGDEVFLIKRGEQPSEDELEYLMTARHTPGVHAKLKASIVGIAGAGGLGSAVAAALARIGVGRLIIADFDVVDPSNLNRQQYFVDQIGQYKVEALTENLRRMNPYVSVDPRNQLLSPDNIPVIFNACSIVVEAFDRPEMKAMLVETLLASNSETIVVASSGLAGYGPGNDIVTRRVSKRLFVVGDAVSEAMPGSGLMAPRVSIAAGHQANQVLRIILGERDETHA